MRAIILNRYSIINEYLGEHVAGLDRSCFLPGALTALRWLRLAGFDVFVISHQPQVSRGEVSHAAVADLHQHLRSWVELSGGRISDIRYSTAERHTGDAELEIDMLHDLADSWTFDLRRAYLVGDTLNDMLAARATNCRRIMVRTGYGAEHVTKLDPHCLADHIALDLRCAVRWVLRQEGLTLPETNDDVLLSTSFAPLRARAVGG